MSTSRSGSQRANSRALTPEEFIELSIDYLRKHAARFAQGPNMYGWDVEGEVDEAIAKTLRKFSPEMNYPVAYALMILRNSAFDHLRKVRLHREVPVGGTASEDEFLLKVANGASVSEHLDHLSFSPEVKAVLQKLRKSYREHLILHAFGFETAEVADRLNTSKGNVSVTRWRAFHAYRKAHEKLFPDSPAPTFSKDTLEVL
ncbi:sigma-70 family RNA polymerase sigma factor [Streptomyces sp. NPDC086082]|uniref:sigma-70 family RNA polymerase sigma factor n=1 Tax=Streptomyces sp. NPDC086082 TaxID=3365750 RepID=UPI00380E27ED